MIRSGELSCVARIRLYLCLCSGLSFASTLLKEYVYVQAFGVGVKATIDLLGI